MSRVYNNFSIEEVCTGVFAALSNGGSNAGIVNLGDETLIFDTFTTVGAGRELKEAAEYLTGRSPSFVINSHAHSDHYHGNVAFSDNAILISSTITRNTIEKEGIIRLERMRNSMMKQADNLRNSLEQTEDIEEKNKIEELLKEYDLFFEDYPTQDDLRLPVLTFENSLSFHGSFRKAKLLTFGGAHSPCDAVLWLPEDGILFSADLIIPNDNLILSQGTPERWLPILKELEALKPKTIVPGHGKVVSASEGFKWARYYLDYIYNLIEEIKPLEIERTIENLEPPAGCRKNWFIENINFLSGKYPNTAK